MSIDLITKVRSRLDVSGGELLVAVEIADAANDAGDGIFIGVNRMADRSRQDPRTVQRQLKRFVEVGWLQIVQLGGGRHMVNGNLVGKPTMYRINPAWVKGDKLPGFDDFEPKHYHRDKGDNLSPLPADEPRQIPPATVTKQGGNGDTAVPGDPLTRIPKDAHARTNPAGSRGAKPEPAPLDPIARVWHWSSVAWKAAISDIELFGMLLDGVTLTVPRGTQPVDLPRRMNAELAPKVRAAAEAATAEECEGRTDHKIIDARITERIHTEMRAFRPATAADRQADGPDPFDPPQRQAAAR